jgi:hypothetical protein
VEYLHITFVHALRVFSPNYLLELEGEDLRRAFRKGWLSDYPFVKLEDTRKNPTTCRVAASTFI